MYTPWWSLMLAAGPHAAFKRWQRRSSREGGDSMLLRCPRASFLRRAFPVCAACVLGASSCVFLPNGPCSVAEDQYEVRVAELVTVGDALEAVVSFSGQDLHPGAQDAVELGSRQQLLDAVHAIQVVIRHPPAEEPIATLRLAVDDTALNSNELLIGAMQRLEHASIGLEEQADEAVTATLVELTAGPSPDGGPWNAAGLSPLLRVAMTCGTNTFPPLRSLPGPTEPPVTCSAGRAEMVAVGIGLWVVADLSEEPLMQSAVWRPTEAEVDRGEAVFNASQQVQRLRLQILKTEASQLCD